MNSPTISPNVRPRNWSFIVHDSRLTASSRQAAISRLEASSKAGLELDVLVIGGGVTGAGIALDAAVRGLSVAIVEAQDWGAGTSSRSSKLIHGGLRYLQMLDFKLVLEALHERDLLLSSIAPHLVRPLPFLYPIRRRLIERLYVGAGILLYDLLATLGPGPRAVPFHRHIGRRGLTETFPGLQQSAAIGAIEYWDATVDDARFVLTLLRTARAHGAYATARTEVVGLTKSRGRITGALLVDLETGREIRVSAKTVVSSTGVWTEETQKLSKSSGGLRVLASKGIHIVVDRNRISGDAALILQTDKSVLFVIPWSRYWVVGTTDTPWQESFTHPVATGSDVDYVLAEANKVLSRPLSRADVIGTWAGLRPLLQPGMNSGTQSAKVSREHTVASPLPGLVVVAGGKFTTYRVMARDTVDFATKHDPKARRSETERIPLIGAAGFSAARRDVESIAERFGWSSQTVQHLLHRYGSGIHDVVELAMQKPELSEALEYAPAYLKAEIVYAASHEGALHLDDVMHRRTRIAYEYPEGGRLALPEVAALVGAELGWSKQTTAKESALFYRRAEAELHAAALSGDAEAMTAREMAELAD
jgi:glycerol-3-phosphate dehydrogenase